MDHRAEKIMAGMYESIICSMKEAVASFEGMDTGDILGPSY
jgi:hypothetical protein